MSLAIGAGFLMSCTSIFVKLASSLSFYEMLIAKCLGVVVFVTPLMIYFSHPFIPKSLKDTIFAAGRGFFGCSGTIFLFFAFDHIPLSDATALAFTAPVWSAILAYFLLGEGWTIFDSVAVVLSLAGVTLITRPSFIFPKEKPDPSYDKVWYAYAAALATSVSLSISYICVRKMNQTGQSFTLVFIYGLVGMSIGIGVGLVDKEGFKLPTCGTLDNIYALLCGLCSFCAQICLGAALKRETTAVVALGRASDVAFVFVLQIIFVDYPANVLSIVGVILVFSCNISIFLKKRFASKNNTK